MADSAGMADLRAENVSRIVKGFALANYRFKELVMVTPSSAWTETYYQETAADLTGGTGSAVKGIPRLAQFPYGEVTWTKQQSRQVKHGMEGVISYEDWKTNAIDVIARTLLRIARAVVKSVDAEIWDVISESQTAVNINSYSITAGYEWNSATLANRDPLQDLLLAKAEVDTDNYDIDQGGFWAVNGTDLAYCMSNDKFRKACEMFTDDISRNGRIGRVVGLDIIKSNNVTADYSMIGIKKICASWKAVVPLTVIIKEEPGINWVVRAWEIGTTQLTDPEALCLIDNTRA
jgi:hypothetical protein